MAAEAGFSAVRWVDHDSEYVDSIRTLQNGAPLAISALMGSFGDEPSDVFGDEPSDVVHCGALIHGVWSLTANFRNFEAIFGYVMKYVKKFLCIDWIDRLDSAIVVNPHLNRNTRQWLPWRDVFFFRQPGCLGDRSQCP